VGESVLPTGIKGLPFQGPLDDLPLTAIAVAQ
jgi:hypothetical protein